MRLRPARLAKRGSFSIALVLAVGVLSVLVRGGDAMEGKNSTIVQNDATGKPTPARQQVAPAVFPHPDKVPPPKWPEAPKASGYKEGMSAKEYFDHLCKTEAGEFIYKTVENVEGIYQMRPREHVTDKMLMDRHFLEDPYGHQPSHEFSMGPDALRLGTIQNGFVNPRYMDAVKLGYELYKPDQNYKFLEKPIPTHLQNLQDGTKYLRYARPNTDKLVVEDGKYLYSIDAQPKLIEERMKEIKSRHGFTWRGIERPRDRELGIAGGELIVLDLQTNEILAVRRGFLLSGNVRQTPEGIFWLRAQSCPNNLPGVATKFLHKVLKPSKS